MGCTTKAAAGWARGVCMRQQLLQKRPRAHAVWQWLLQQWLEVQTV